MTYSELQDQGRKLDVRALPGELRRLADDPHFSGLVAWLDRNLESWEESFTQQSLAGDHGKLAHAAGSVYALRVLRRQLANTLFPARPKQPTPADQS
jgi:hypothetical protein